MIVDPEERELVEVPCSRRRPEETIVELLMSLDPERRAAFVRNFTTTYLENGNLGAQLDAAERAAGVWPDPPVDLDGQGTLIGANSKLEIGDDQVVVVTVVVVGERVIVTSDAEDAAGALRLLLRGAQDVTDQIAGEKHEDTLRGGGIFSSAEPEV